MYLDTTNNVMDTRTYAIAIEIHRVPENGAKKANKVGGSFSGALYRIAIPSFMKGMEKSTAPFRWVLIVKSAMAKSAF